MLWVYLIQHGFQFQDFFRLNGNICCLTLQKNWYQIVTNHFELLLRCILDLEHRRNQRKGSELFSREVDLMRWFPVALFTNDVFIVTSAGFQLTTPVLWVRSLDDHTRLIARHDYNLTLWLETSSERFLLSGFNTWQSRRTSWNMIMHDQIISKMQACYVLMYILNLHIGGGGVALWKKGM